MKGGQKFKTRSHKLKKTVELKFRLDDVKEVICKWLHLEDSTMIDVVCGTYIANKFDSDPLWMNTLSG